MSPGSESVAWKRPESILVIVVNHDDEYLVMERVQPAGFWQSITGSLEPDETPAQAAQRELMEETGIDAVPVSQEYFVDFPIREPWRQHYAPDVEFNREHVFVVALANRVDVVLCPEEHCRFEWVSREQALERLSSPTNIAAVQRLYE